MSSIGYYRDRITCGTRVLIRDRSGELFFAQVTNCDTDGFAWRLRDANGVIHRRGYRFWTEHGANWQLAGVYTREPKCVLCDHRSIDTCIEHHAVCMTCYNAVASAGDKGQA